MTGKPLKYPKFVTFSHSVCPSVRRPPLWYKKPRILKNIRARGRIIFLFFPRAARALKIRQTNSAILKVPDGAWNSRARHWPHPNMVPFYRYIRTGFNNKFGIRVSTKNRWNPGMWLDRRRRASDASGKFSDVLVVLNLVRILNFSTAVPSVCTKFRFSSTAVPTCTY